MTNKRLVALLQTHQEVSRTILSTLSSRPSNRDNKRNKHNGSNLSRWVVYLAGF